MLGWNSTSDGNIPQFFNANGNVLVVGIQWDHMDHTIFSLDEIFGGCMRGGTTGEPRDFPLKALDFSTKFRSKIDWDASVGDCQSSSCCGDGYFETIRCSRCHQNKGASFSHRFHLL